MIFASDLDRTLIYSEKFTQDLLQDQIEIVEKKEEKPLSYMTKEAVKNLKKIHEKILFIPVTTRTIEQYRRIHLFKHMDIEYAITSNGGNILVNGEVDKEWNHFIMDTIKKECISFEDVFLKFKEIESKEWMIKNRVADDLFIYYIIHKDYIPERLYDFIQWLEDRNFRVSIQGRKMYFVPKCVSKGKALSYIKEKEGIEDMIVAGDSLLDLPMLKIGDHSIAPTHGEIYQIKEKVDFINFTEKEGIFAGEEILKKVSECMENEKCFCSY
ncbi:HAD family hydrolase [Inediibacterium massiliense]|uniref:HAD family hydrolase n=1 Tax=Inediibacterium massiliense TaxID=1658111 RepID=UPI0006B5BD89|nr:HAD hydrolase family protein [Inediibacterium massiliense]